MKTPTIAIGCEFFQEIRKNNFCYVDKTYIIEELLNNFSSSVCLFTRPRRFGKTLTLSMLQEFFDINKKSNKIFEGLEVWKNKIICDKWMNKYPLIFISLKNIEGDFFNKALRQFSITISYLFSNIDYLLKSSRVKKSDKKNLDLLINEKADVELLKNALLIVSRAMADYWNSPVIILIDEYDVPLNSAEQSGYYREMIGFMRAVLGSALETNPSLKLAVLTGCLRIAKESIFTGVNNFKCFGVSDNRFADAFGFTSEEVDKLLEQAALTGKKPTFQEWYDGYTFGREKEIYCPWDVLQYIADLQYDKESRPQAYWSNTSGNVIVRALLQNSSDEARQTLEKLLSGEEVEIKSLSTNKRRG